MDRNASKGPVGWPGTYPESAASFPLAKSSKPVEDEDEWEYEYSTTETETYYVTMDLSHPGMFEKVKDVFHAQNRGGYKQWFNPVYADPNKNSRLRPTNTNAVLFADDEDKDDEDMAPREDDENENGNGTANGDGNDDNPIDPQLRDARAASVRAVSMGPQAAGDVQQNGQSQLSKPARLRTVGEIQVLDLHSDNPIISYKGRIFSGSWASNIGTELIFGSHDEIDKYGLPYLRSVSSNVDLLAASSARILTTPADLRPRNPNNTTVATRHPVHDHYKKLRKESGIEIPVAFDKHGFRKPQARFLENLMAIKRKRGETDEVTTMTKDTTRPYVNKEDDPEEASNQKKRARDRRRQQKLVAEKVRRPGAKTMGGNRRTRRKSVTSGDREGEGNQPSGSGDGNWEGLSTRTPSRWEDLGGARVAEGDNDAEDTATRV